MKHTFILLKGHDRSSAFQLRGARESKAYKLQIADCLWTKGEKKTILTALASRRKRSSQSVTLKWYADVLMNTYGVGILDSLKVF
jgi:hypothetical protein